MQGGAVVFGAVMAVVSLSAATHVTSAGADAKPIDLVTSRPTIGYLGGRVTLRASLPPASDCSWASSRRMVGFGGRVRCKGHLSRVAVIPANTAATPRALRFTLVASNGRFRHMGEAVVTQVGKPAATTTSTTAPPQSFPGGSTPNWAGYVLSGQSGGYHGVSGEWTVPTIDCGPVPEGNTADWVGVNGFSTTSPGLFQDGTISQCDNGRQLDFAWWTDEAENYASIPLFSVSPGDLIEAEVFREPAGSWAYYISDLTTGAMASSVTPFAGPGLTAEWIAEDPSYTSSGPLYPLADFGTVTFSDLGLNTPGEKWPAPPPSDAVEMLQPNGEVEAMPSPLHQSQGEVSFTVSYEAPGQMAIARAQPALESQTTSVTRAVLPGR